MSAPIPMYRIENILARQKFGVRVGCWSCPSRSCRAHTKIGAERILKTLAHQIEQQLQRGEWKHCAVYEPELQRLWPLDEENRETKIAQFCEHVRFPAEVLP